MVKLALPSDIDALIITNPYNILYLCGFKGFSDTEREAILVCHSGLSRIKQKDSGVASLPRMTMFTLITARLYQTEANKLKSKDLDVKISSERDKIQQLIFETLKGCQKIGFEKSNLTVAEHERYKNLLPGKDFIATENIVEDLRKIKTAGEIAKIEKAQIISQNALASLLPTIKAGQTEAELAERLESIMRSLGSQGAAFTSIIASGPNSGIPHHATSDRRLTIHDTLLFDFGAKYQYYCADLSRTVFVGKPNGRQVNIYNHVANAQRSAIAKITNGIKNHEPFQTANNLFIKNKLDSYFLHGLGHGIGLEVHEEPYLRHTANEQALTNNMVFSVEPGLYFPWGGVRIEDLVVIENGKPRVLGKMQEGIVVV
jgi:Xaa-Pro aminopeptidase